MTRSGFLGFHAPAIELDGEAEFLEGGVAIPLFRDREGPEHVVGVVAEVEVAPGFVLLFLFFTFRLGGIQKRQASGSSTSPTKRPAGGCGANLTGPKG